MKIVFFGTPSYVLKVLEKIYKSFRTARNPNPIVAVVTQPAKPVGREKKLEHSPVDNWAYKRKIPVLFSAKDLIDQKIKADIGIIASFGKIIPLEVINHFTKGIVNIHPSLLPKYRGASPIQAAIVSGETKTGVTFFKIDEKLDHGPIISQFEEEIFPNDTTASLRERLFEKAAEVLVRLIPPYLEGKVSLRVQDDSKASYTKILTKNDAFIPPQFLELGLKGETGKKDWNIGFIENFKIRPDAKFLERFIRAMQPWPISWTFVKIRKETKRLKLLKVKLIKEAEKEKLDLNKVQLEGKKPVSWAQFLQGYPDASF